jgi:hypothetical protein
MTVAELRAELRARALSTTGVKSALLARLQDALSCAPNSGAPHGSPLRSAAINSLHETGIANLAITRATAATEHSEDLPRTIVDDGPVSSVRISCSISLPLQRSKCPTSFQGKTRSAG